MVYGGVYFKQASRVKLALASHCGQRGRTGGRLDVPTIAEPLDLADWLGQQSATPCLDPRAPNVWAILRWPLHCPADRPQGGLSPAEVTRCVEATFIPTTLGPRVLRTETAPVAALAVIQHCLGQ